MPLPADGSKLKLGKGSLLLDQLVDGVSQGFDFAGNCTAITLSADVQTVQKFSATQQSAPLIGRATTQVAYTISATLDEFDFQMLRKFLLASENTSVQPLNVGTAAQFVSIVQGRYYQLGGRQITNLAMLETATPLVENVDYTLNAEFGIVRFLPGSIVATDGDTIDATFDTALLNIEQLQIAQIASPTCHLLYLADDANADGVAAKDRLEIWRVNLAPEGELNLISDDYGSYQLTMAVIDDSANHPADPFGVYERIVA